MGKEPEKFPGGEGEECWTCWGGGKPWEGQDIPAIVFVNFSGIVACDSWEPAPNGVFTLAQEPINICTWSTDIPNWCRGLTLHIEWTLGEDYSFLVASVDWGHPFYFHSDLPPCQTFFVSDRLTCVEEDYPGRHGIGVIT